MCWMKLMISVDIVLMTFRQQIHPKQDSAQSVMCSQLQHEVVKGQLTKVHKVSLKGTTAGNFQPRKTWFEQRGQLFCFTFREIHKPTLTEITFPKRSCSCNSWNCGSNDLSQYRDRQNCQWHGRCKRTLTAFRRVLLIPESFVMDLLGASQSMVTMQRCNWFASQYSGPGRSFTLPTTRPCGCKSVLLGRQFGQLST